MLNRPASFFCAPTTAARPRVQKRIPLPAQGEAFAVGCFLLVRAATQYVRGQKALGPLHEFVFHGFSLIEGPIAIFLDRGKVDKDVFPGRALNEAIAFGSVEPLYSSLLFHKCNSFRLSFRLEISAFKCKKVKKKVVALPARWLFSATDGCRAGRPEGDSSNRIVRRVQTAVQKHQPECALRTSRREQSIIFRNSGSCKALCLHSAVTPKGNRFMRPSFLPKWNL